MTDDTRLAEIETRYGDIEDYRMNGPNAQFESYTPYSDAVALFMEKDVPLLLARVAALEAQAALDGAACGAARGVYACISYRDRQWGSPQWAALDAALAARDAAGKGE
jgi:hypothetical protein